MSRRPTPHEKPVPTRRAFDRLEQVRVLAHPLRLRLVEVFAEGPCTPKQAAERLGLPPTRLYHHVATLERVGLVRVRETRRNRGTIEKHYEAVARNFEMDPTKFAHGRSKSARLAAVRLADASAGALAMRVVERAGDALSAAMAAEDFAELAPDDPRRPMAIGAGIVASPKRLVEMRDELAAVITGWHERGEKEKAKPGEETLRAWLTIVFVPEATAKAKAREASRPGKKREKMRPGERKPGGGS